MELRQLRYFVAIAEERSFSRAAERLWLSQPALSTQIGRLERELGVQLFIRHTRGVDLTAAGELFLERARTTLAAADCASATGPDLQAGVAGDLRIGLSTDARWQHSASLLAQFARERPGVELTVLEGYSGTLWRHLRDGRTDALIAPAGLGSPDLRSFSLGAQPWVVLVGSRHRLAGHGPFHAHDLQGEKIAVTAHRDGAEYDRAVADTLAELGVAAALVPGAPAPALQATVAAGDALALVAAPECLHPDVAARPLAPGRTLAFELLSRDEQPSPPLGAFIELATQPVPSMRPITASHLPAVA